VSQSWSRSDFQDRAAGYARLVHLAARRLIGWQPPANRHGAFHLAMHRVAGTIEADRRGERRRGGQKGQGENERAHGLMQA